MSKRQSNKEEVSKTGIRIAAAAGSAALLIGAIILVTALGSGKNSPTPPTSESSASQLTSDAETKSEVSSATSSSEVFVASESSDSESTASAESEKSASSNISVESKKSASSKNTVESKKSSSSKNTVESKKSASSKNDAESKKSASSKNNAESKKSASSETAAQSSKAAASEKTTSSKENEAELPFIFNTSSSIELPFVPVQPSSPKPDDSSFVQMPSEESRLQPNDENETPILSIEELLPEEEKLIYVNGEYEKTVSDDSVNITVTITIESDKITDIKAESDSAENDYLKTVIDEVVPKIKEREGKDLSNLDEIENEYKDNARALAVISAVKEALIGAQAK